MDDKQLENIIDAIVRQLVAAGIADEKPVPPIASPTPHHPDPSTGSSEIPISSNQNSPDNLVIDLPDPTTPDFRIKTHIQTPLDIEGLEALVAVSSSRIGIGRAGTRYRTAPWLLFQADQAITQDTLMRDVSENMLQQLGLFTVQTMITEGKEQYLIRPDLGRQLSTEARQLIQQKCSQHPQVQLCVGDGLSAQAIEANLPQILPVIQQGCQTAGLSFGTPFFIQHCRVGVMNDIGDLIHPEVLILLIGERPGLGRADSMSAYMGFRPQKGNTDADRDVICNIFDAGGTNPLEAGAYAVQIARKMIHHQASGIKLKMLENTSEGK